MMYSLKELYRNAQDEGIDVIGDVHGAEELLSLYLPGVPRNEIAQILGKAAVYLDTHYDFPYTTMDKVQRALEMEVELNAG